MIVKQFLRLLTFLFGVYVAFTGINGVFVHLNPPNERELSLITQTIYPYQVLVYVGYIIAGLFMGVLAIRWWYKDFRK